MTDEATYQRPLFREVDESDVDLLVAIKLTNRASQVWASASSQAEKLGALLMYVDAIEGLIEPCEGLSDNSRALMSDLRKGIISLQRGYTPEQLKPVPIPRKPRYDYNEWNRRALLAYCYYVLIGCNFSKSDALDQLNKLASECNVKLTVGFEQAIINNFKYKVDGIDQDKYEAVQLYEQMLDAFNKYWKPLNLSRTQALIWCRRTLIRGKAFPELDNLVVSSIHVRGSDGVLRPLEEIELSPTQVDDSSQD